MVRTHLVLLLLATLLIIGCATGAALVPLPDDVKVAPPASDIPPELRAYSGRWYGVWDGVLPHVLVVEEILAPDQVKVIYAWGHSMQW